MKQTIRWTTSSHVVRTIADDSFGGWEQALAEAIKNSLEAESTRIDITVPTREILVEDPQQKVVIEDNGNGMSLDDLRDSFCCFGRFKPQHRGTGKVATLKVAQKVLLETWRDGNRHEFQFTTSSVLNSQGGEEPESEVKTTTVPKDRSGTSLTLFGFSQNVAPPSVPHTHHVLLRNFHDKPGVSFFVNSVEFDESDHATEVLSVEREAIKGVGTASLTVLLAKPREQLSHPGLMVYSGSQAIHGPDLFGLTSRGYRGDADKVTKRILGRVDLHPDDAGPVESGAWTMSTQYLLIDNWVTQHLEAIVDKETAEAVDGRVDKWLQDKPTRRYYNKLPADEKATARRILREQAKKTSGGSNSAQTIINRLVCRSLHSDALAVVLDVLDDSSNEEVESFGELFKGYDKWTLRQVTRAASLVKHHMQAVEDLEGRVADYSKNEWEIHTILKENPWLIADDYHSFRSNRQIRTTLKKLFDIDADEQETLKRPDFFFGLGDASSSSLAQPGRYLFIELKGPDQPLDLSHQNQVVGDAKIFMRHQPGFAFCVLIGTEHNPKNPPDPETESKGAYSFRSMTYAQIIERAKFRLEYIAEGVRESGTEALARRILQSEVEMLVDQSSRGQTQKRHSAINPPAGPSNGPSPGDTQLS